MKKDVWRNEWHLVTNAEAHEVTGSSAAPGLVYPYEVQKLPSQLQKLPGLYASYISGYSTASVSPENVLVLGEVAAVREDEGTGKGYVWVFGVSGSGVYVNGPYKYFTGHHFQDTGSVPVDKLFGNVPSYPSNPKTGCSNPIAKQPVGATACPKCNTNTVAHNGGEWCPQCGTFVTPPDFRNTGTIQANQPSPSNPFQELQEAERVRAAMPRCAKCQQPVDVVTGIYDDGEWLCRSCIGA